jgi:hypothetical protein
MNEKTVPWKRVKSFTGWAKKIDTSRLRHNQYKWNKLTIILLSCTCPPETVTDKESKWCWHGRDDSTTDTVGGTEWPCTEGLRRNWSFLKSLITIRDTFLAVTSHGSFATLSRVRVKAYPSLGYQTKSRALTNDLRTKFLRRVICCGVSRRDVRY